MVGGSNKHRARKHNLKFIRSHHKKMSKHCNSKGNEGVPHYPEPLLSRGCVRGLLGSGERIWKKEAAAGSIVFNLSFNTPSHRVSALKSVSSEWNNWDCTGWIDRLACLAESRPGHLRHHHHPGEGERCGLQQALHGLLGGDSHQEARGEDKHLLPLRSV